MNCNSLIFMGMRLPCLRASLRVDQPLPWNVSSACCRIRAGIRYKQVKNELGWADFGALRGCDTPSLDIGILCLYLLVASQAERFATQQSEPGTPEPWAARKKDDTTSSLWPVALNLYLTRR
jgi:hypothetical protein